MADDLQTQSPGEDPPRPEEPPLAEGGLDARCLLEQLWKRSAGTTGYLIASRILNNAHDAEDAVATAFYRAARAIQRGHGPNPEGDPVAWLLTIVRNCSRDLRRQRRNGQHPVDVDPDQFPDNSPPPLETLALSGESESLWQAIEQLDERTRNIILLRYRDGLSNCEIAIATGNTKGNVSLIIHRAKIQIGAILGDA